MKYKNFEACLKAHLDEKDSAISRANEKLAALEAALTKYHKENHSGRLVVCDECWNSLESYRKECDAAVSSAHSDFAQKRDEREKYATVKKLVFV